MTAAKTTRGVKDADATTYARTVLDESGTGSGPFAPTHASVDATGALINPATNESIAALAAQMASGIATTPAVAAFVNRSGTVASDGTSQQIAAANASRKRLLIQNPSSAAGQGIGTAESLFVNFTSVAAVAGGSSLELLPGGVFDTAGGPVTSEAITVAAASAGHKFIAKEM